MRYVVENKYKRNYMMQIYSKKTSRKQMQPAKETIQFLLDFSKSLKVVKAKPNFIIELNLN